MSHYCLGVLLIFKTVIRVLHVSWDLCALGIPLICKTVTGVSSLESCIQPETCVL